MTILPHTRLGRWAAALSGFGLLIFVLNIVILQRITNVSNTNTGQEVSGQVNDTLWTLLPIYAIFALLVLGGVLAVAAITKRDRAILVWTVGIIGLLALWIFIGGFFVEET